MLNNITHQSTEINLFYFKNIKISISKKILFRTLWRKQGKRIPILANLKTDFWYHNITSAVQIKFLVFYREADIF